MGRRKIKIAFLKDANTRHATFSKRKLGLFKKANELSILCGVEIAVVLFSAQKKPYSFGIPSVDAIAAKFLQQEFEPNDAQGNSSSKSVDMEKLNQELFDVLAQVRDGWDGVPENYDANSQLSMLQELRDSYTELNSTVKSRITELKIADELKVAEYLLMLAREPVKEKGGKKGKRKVNA